MKRLAFGFRALGAALAALVSVSLSAAELAFSVMPPAGAVVAGKTARVDVAAMNPAALEVHFELESTLEGVLKAGSASWPVKLEAAGAPPVAVGPGGFAVRQFHFDVPAQAVGDVILELRRTDGSVLRTALTVGAPASASAATVTGSTAAAPQAAAATPLDALKDATPAAAAIARNFPGRFLPNMPVYFIYGSGEQQAKFQLSFDYRLGTMVFGPEDNKTVVTLRAGYTQRSLWELGSDSSPFYDTSYMPEIAFATEAPKPREDGLLTWLGLRAGFQHESNGKSGTDSRTLNTAYVRPRFVLGSMNDWFVVFLPEVFAYVGGLAENPDLKDYRGYGRMRFYVGRNDGPSLMFTGWTGKDFDHGTYQLDLAVPTRLKWVNLEAFLYLQYFNGYGESLLSYRTKSDAVRAGLSLVR